MYRDDLAAAHTRIQLLETQTGEGAIEELLVKLEAEREHWIAERARRVKRRPLRLYLPSFFMVAFMLRDAVMKPTSSWPITAAIMGVGATILFFAMRQMEGAHAPLLRDADLKLRALESRIAEVRAFAATHGRLRVANTEDAAALNAHDEPENYATELRSTDR